jgi:MoaA/NifB/PqqE/SkfB family radical SAM enzyme
LKKDNDIKDKNQKSLKITPILKETESFYAKIPIKEDKRLNSQMNSLIKTYKSTKSLKSPKTTKLNLLPVEQNSLNFPNTSIPIYNEVGLEKLMLFPDKLKSLLSLTKSPFDPLYPISVELSLTNKCDLNCLFCSDSSIRKSPDRMTQDILEKLFLSLARGGTRGITIEGGGEPTLSPLFKDAIRIASKLSLSLGLITSGSRIFSKLTKDDFLQFNWIRVSLDASSPESFKKLKGKDGYKEILSNIKTLCSLTPKPVIGVGYVLTNLNDDQNSLIALIKELKSLEVNYLQIRPVVDHIELTSLKDILELKSLSTPSFQINLKAISENEPSGNLGLPCLSHSLTTVIGADALVWICGRLNSLHHFLPMGDLTKNSFKEIWEGETRRSQAETLKNPSYCQKNCPQCRLTKYNSLLYGLSQIKTRDFI